MVDTLASPSSRSLAEPLLNGNTFDNDAISSTTWSQDEPPEPSPSPATASPSSARRNINLVLLYTLLMFAGRSMWSQTVLSAYVYLLRNEDPESVGILTAVMGISQLLFSFPAGYLADKFRRDRMLKMASVVGLVAISTTIVASHQRSYWLLAFALSIWGSFWGVAYTCISALFADSIRDGERSLWFTRRMILIKLGNMGGPVAVLVMFLVLGDRWTTHECAFVMTCGQVLCSIPVLMLCFVSDDNTVAEGETGDEDDAVVLTDTRSSSTDHESLTTGDISLPAADGEDNGDNSYIDAFHENEQQAQQAQSRSCFCLSKHRYVPAMVAGADIFSGIAAGMSIRYFPIFFLHNVELGPVVVQVLFLLSVGVQIPISMVAQRGAKVIGRCEMTVAFKWVGIVLFVSMILSYKADLPAAITCIFWVFRTGSMNATSALTKSIIMDEVPKNERARWAALESVNMFSWSGSAFLGGVLVKEEGIIFNFCVTSALQLFATIPLITLFGKVRNEGATVAQTSQSRPERPCEEGEQRITNRPSQERQ